MNNHKTLQLAQEEWKETHKKKKAKHNIPTIAPSFFLCLKEESYAKHNDFITCENVLHNNHEKPHLL